MKKMTKLEAINELNTLDHCFINEEGVATYTKPFGFMGSTYLAKTDPPGTFKGLSLQDKDGNSIQELRGNAAHVVAEQIARHLDVNYPDMHGVGSRLRAACEAVLKLLDGQNK